MGKGGSMLRMAGGEQNRGVPTAVQTPGRKAGAQAGRQPVLSPLYVRGMGFFNFSFFPPAEY